MSTKKITIFADGASSGNPGPGGWGALVFLKDQWITELGGHEPHTTNNRMELMAVIRALEFLGDQALNGFPIQVFTDSQYVIRGITSWIHQWQKNGWVSSQGKDVLNPDLWKTLVSLASGKEIEWTYVPGHSGVVGNERVDQIAVAFSLGKKPDLFTGSYLDYPLPLDTKSKQSYPIYLSFVDQILMRHTTWAECETRVKGKAGAKFKKVKNSVEEADILKNWNVRS